MIGNASRIVIIGAGKLARALAHTYTNRIIGVVARNPAPLFSKEFPGIPVYHLLHHVHDAYTVIWIAVTDRAITSMTHSMVAERESWEGVTVVHSSGALSVVALELLQKQGARTITLHPNVSLTGGQPIPKGLVWSVSGIGDYEETAHSLIAPLEPQIVAISDDKRNLYHAAASAAANYSRTLFAMATELYAHAGVPLDMASQIVRRFMEDSAAQSGETTNMLESLTGPVARGDIETVNAQLQAIQQTTPHLLALMVELGRSTAEYTASTENRRAWNILFDSFMDPGKRKG